MKRIFYFLSILMIAASCGGNTTTQDQDVDKSQLSEERRKAMEQQNYNVMRGTWEDKNLIAANPRQAVAYVKRGEGFEKLSQADQDKAMAEVRKIGEWSEANLSAFAEFGVEFTETKLTSFSIVTKTREKLAEVDLSGQPFGVGIVLYETGKDPKIIAPIPADEALRQELKAYFGGAAGADKGMSGSGK